MNSYTTQAENPVEKIVLDHGTGARLSRELVERIAAILGEVVETIVAVCMRLSARANTRQVVLSGGVFCNEFLLINAMERLSAAGLDPYCHQRVPTHDGGISLGQVVVAASLVGTPDTHIKENAHV